MSSDSRLLLRCLDGHHHVEKYKDNSVRSSTVDEQEKVEDSVGNCFLYFKNVLSTEPEEPELLRKKHESFLLNGLSNLSQSYSCLDASRPWLCYWILHSMELLNIPLSDDKATEIIQFLGKCQSPSGGFGGGPMQEPHLATTYAAVNALCIIGTEEAYKIIDRVNLAKFLRSRRGDDGSFTMHEGGEVDIRGAYCAASAARLTNVANDEMSRGTPEWIIGCQTYEGGFAGVPGMEAHGGYSFCGLAALMLFGHEKLADTKRLLRWTVHKQMGYEGGFQGRTNKLVDGCYSFWQGGALPLIHMILANEGEDCLSAERWMFHQGALQEYLLICCQSSGGGLIDKPGKQRDYYHTCYCLSGLSVAQHFLKGKIVENYVLGSANNKLKRTHPVFNIGLDAVDKAQQFFSKLEVPKI